MEPETDSDAGEPEPSAEPGGGTDSMPFALFATIIVVAGVKAQGPAQRNASGDVVTSGTVPIFDLHPKDCFTLPSGLIGSSDSKVRTLSVKPCSTPHDGEAIGTFTSSDGSYP